MSYPKVIVAQNGLVVPHGAKGLPASTVASLYTISGGAILLMQILGFVTTVIQTQACNLKLQQKATGQTAIDMCAVTNISALAVGNVVGITGIETDALLAGFGIRGMASRIVLPGTIDLSTSATNTGALRWMMRYFALDPGAMVVAT